MRFVNPEFLWLLLFLPLLALVYARKGAARFSLMLRLILRLLCLILLITALARPQYGSAYTEVEASGIDIMLAVDISQSMLAMDFTLDDTPVSRLEVVKKVVNDFIDKRPNDRIGLTIFSGKPYLISPLTLDHDWLRKRLEIIEIGMIKEGGTAIGSAIAAGVNRLRKQRAKSKILILLTDGVSNTGRIPPLTAAEAAKALGFKIYTIGAGTQGEAPTPIVDPFGRRRLVRVPVEIDDKTLQKVADMTGALYFRATDTKSLRKVYDEINRLEKTTHTIKRFENYTELFPYLLGIFLLLCAGELFYIKQRLP